MGGEKIREAPGGKGSRILLRNRILLMNKFHSNRATRNLDVNGVLFMAFNGDSEFSTLNSGKATELCTQMAQVGKPAYLFPLGFEDKHFSF